MSADGGSSTEGARVVVHDTPGAVATVTPGDVFVRYVIDDEFTGPVTLTTSLSHEDARKVADWTPSVARLYLGHNVGFDMQAAIRTALGD